MDAMYRQLSIEVCKRISKGFSLCAGIHTGFFIWDMCD